MAARSFSGLGAVKVTCAVVVVDDVVVVFAVIVAVDESGGGFGRKGARGAVNGTGTLMMGARGR